MKQNTPRGKMWPQQMWYPPYPQPPQYPPFARPPMPYMYTEYPYEWQPPQRRRNNDDVTHDSEVLVATGFTTLVESMLGAMKRGLNSFPPSMRVTPFAAFTTSDAKVSNDVASVRGSGPSVVDYDAVVPESADGALTEGIRFVDWMLTQAGPNLHHTQHAAFNAALRMVRAVLRYTRVVYRHRHGGPTGDAEPIGSDPEMAPATPTAKEALVASRILHQYIESHLEQITDEEAKLGGFQKLGELRVFTSKLVTFRQLAGVLAKKGN